MSSSHLCTLFLLYDHQLLGVLRKIAQSTSGEVDLDYRKLALILTSRVIQVPDYVMCKADDDNVDEEQITSYQPVPIEVVEIAEEENQEEVEQGDMHTTT